MNDKVKITFVLPETLQREFREKFISQGYHLKDKSKWVGEAIEALLINPNFPDLVKINDEMKGFEKSESILISKTLKQILDLSVLEIRKRYPVIEGVQSRILRTAIVQRLLRS